VVSVPINAVTTREKGDDNEIPEKKEKKQEEMEETPVNQEDLEVVVFTVGKDNKVKKVIVKTGIQDINHIEITEGLEDGEEVVTGPYEVVSKKLKTGTEVKKTDKKDLYKEEK
jgi:HlyD family secretion protein